MTTSSRAIYNAVYNGCKYKGATEERCIKIAERAETRYLQNQFETPQQLIELMTEGALK